MTRIVNAPLNSNLILLIRRHGQEWILDVLDFKFQSDSINTDEQPDCLHRQDVFKFQSDSINTKTAQQLDDFYDTLNSNLILLIHGRP